MRMRQHFKNPDEDSSANELDELVDDDEDANVINVINAMVAEAAAIDEALDEIGEDDDLDVDYAPDGGPEPLDADEDDDEEISSDDSFDPNASDSDDSMNDSDDEEKADEAAKTKANKSKTATTTTTTQTAAAADISDADEAAAGPSSSAGRASSGGAEVGEAASALADLNEEDEEDETVRAIIAAIKKPRTSPPEIKLEDFITDICFHPERDIIALATITGDVALYAFANEGNTLLRTVEVHAKACRDVEFSDDGRDLLTCSKDKSIMITDMETEKLKKFYEAAHDEPINKLFVLDEHLFATGDDGGTVKLWDLRTKTAIFALKEVEDYITQILTNESKKLLLVTSGDGYLTTLNIGARKLYVQSEPYEEELTCMGIYRGDSKLVAGTSKGRLYTYNWGQFGYHCDMYPGIKTPISEMIPITDRIGCIAGEEGIINACHIAPYRALGVVGQHNMPIENLDISSSGELIASSSHNNDVRFWNVKYFEEFGDIKYNEKHQTYKEKRHNLPSSKIANAGDFFSDLAGGGGDDVE